MNIPARWILAFLIPLICVSGCATTQEALKTALGISTRDIEACRKDALVKVLDCDYRTCYDKTYELLKAMPKVSIYAKRRDMIAIYYLDPNTTPVGVFFEEIDVSHTRIEVSSQGSGSKEFIAKCVFAGKIEETSASGKKFPESVEY